MDEKTDRRCLKCHSQVFVSVVSFTFNSLVLCFVTYFLLAFFNSVGNSEEKDEFNTNSNENVQKKTLSTCAFIIVTIQFSSNNLYYIVTISFSKNMCFHIQ